MEPGGQDVYPTRDSPGDLQGRAAIQRSLAAGVHDDMPWGDSFASVESAVNAIS